VRAVGLGSGRYPDCEPLSTSRHSRYVRYMQDLPVQGITVALCVKLSRWRCRDRRCERKTFSDLLPRIARPFARRTRRVSELTHLVGHAAGGRLAEWLMTRLGLPQSDDTILWQLKRHQAERGEVTPVRVAGIDDWSWRKVQLRHCLRAASACPQSQHASLIGVAGQQDDPAQERHRGQEDHAGGEIAGCRLQQPCTARLTAV
jgi:hypothetical protein